MEMGGFFICILVIYQILMTRLAKNILLSLISLGLSLCLAELGLRILGDTPGSKPVAYEPERFLCKDPFRKDVNAGWSLKPGSYSIKQEGREEPVAININTDGSRITSHYPVSNNKQIILIGDSYTFGHGLNDNETLGWLLQAKISDATVINHGVGGYGTCQVLIKSRELAHHIRPGAKVIYGLSSFHSQRNVADPRSDYWIAMTSPDRSSHYPHCKLRDNKESHQVAEAGRIVILPPKTWHPIIPLTGYLALSRRITNTYLSLISESSESQRSITLGIIGEIKRLVSDRESELIVLLQDIDTVDQQYYQDELKHLRIRMIDGNLKRAADSLRLSDGHPSPELNIIWAGMIEDTLRLE